MLVNSGCLRRVVREPVFAANALGRLQGLSPAVSPFRRVRCYPDTRAAVPLLGFCLASPRTYRIADHGAHTVFRSCASPTCLPTGIEPKPEGPTSSQTDCASTVYSAVSGAWSLDVRTPLLRFAGLSRPTRFEAVRSPVLRWPIEALRHKTHETALPVVSWAHASSTGVWEGRDVGLPNTNPP